MFRSYIYGWKNALNTKTRTKRKEYYKFVFADLLISFILLFAWADSKSNCEEVWRNAERNEAVIAKRARLIIEDQVSTTNPPFGKDACNFNRREFKEIFSTIEIYLDNKYWSQKDATLTKNFVKTNLLIPFKISRLFTLYMLLTIIPRISITARRIKDAGKRTNWMLFTFLPIPGWIILWFMTMQESTSTSQQSTETSNPPKTIEDNTSKNESINNFESKLEELNRLKEKGLINKDEYEKLRKNALGL